MSTKTKYEYRLYDGGIVLREPKGGGAPLQRYSEKSGEWEEITVDGPTAYDSPIGWWMFSSPLTEDEAKKLTTSKD
jgi:hypothetical protein